MLKETSFSFHYVNVFDAISPLEGMQTYTANIV